MASAQATSQVGAVQYTSEELSIYDLARLKHITGPELDTFMEGSPMSTGFRGKFPEPKNEVRLVKVSYHSVVPEMGNKETIATGLVAFPLIASTRLPMVSYQHGTVFDKSYVPSQPENSDETRLALATFAAHGYVVIAADYFGRGDSDLPDSYLARGSTLQANWDFYCAARDLIARSGIEVTDFFVSGWSQGGWVTLQHLHNLETRGVQVVAAAIASTPVDFTLCVNRWMNNPLPIDAPYFPGCFTLQLVAQEIYHNVPGLVASAVKPEYIEAALAFYRGQIDFTEFSSKTPLKLSEYLNEEFRQTGFACDSPFWKILETSNAYRWRMKTPLRVYWGGSDEVTPKAIAYLPENTQALLGGTPVQTIYSGDLADHRGVYVHGLLDQKIWFDSLLRGWK